MSSILEPKIAAFLADAAIAKGKVVKIGSDKRHVAVCSAATQKAIGIMQSAPDAAEAVCEVAMPGDGAKALCGGTVAAGDLLASDAAGKVVATTTANDRVVAVALEGGAANDLISVVVMLSNV